MARSARIVAGALALSMGALLYAAHASDETSTSDKLRILYSNRFTFTDDGFPLVTVEIMSGQKKVRLSAKAGVSVLPDGEGGAQIDGGSNWTITVENARPAKMREWTVVSRLSADDDIGSARALTQWRDRGFTPKRFEIGTVFGVDGEVIDSREVLVAVAPTRAGKGSAKAREIARKYNIKTEVHPEMVRRPSGTVVAKSGSLTVRNSSVLWFAPRGADKMIRVADVVVGGGGSQLKTQRKDRRYFGLIYITIGKDAKLTAVNAIATDKLLAGLVPSEMFPEAPQQALAAQAIAARTELLQKIGTRHFGDPFLLCSSQHCQVYSGAGHEHPRTTKAVRNTRGMVLLREGGGLVDARYSAACGGHSEHKENIWGGRADPSLRGGVDSAANSSLIKKFRTGVSDKNISSFLAQTGGAYCSGTKYSKGRYRWTKTVSSRDLDRLVARHYPSVGSVRSIETLERGVSGRLKRVRLKGNRGTAMANGDLHIRRLLGGLRSSLFTVRRLGSASSPEAFEFKGAGFGHGVGMCQIGAIGMAEKRNGFREILNHYYAGSRIHRLY